MMNVNVDFPSNIEAVLLQQAAAAGRDVPAFIREVVTERLVSTPFTARPQNMSHEEFAKRLDAWIKRHPVVNHVLDDSRESIYEGRGE